MRKPAAGTHQGCREDNALSCPSGEYCRTDPSQGPIGECRNTQLRWWDLPDACRSCDFYDVEDCCSARAGTRYVEFAAALERRAMEARPASVVESICEESFGDSLSRIANELVLTSELTLAPPPESPENLRVTIRSARPLQAEKALVYGHDYTVRGTSLIFRGEDQPQPGDDIEVTYTKWSGSPGACAAHPLPPR
jgi:hypothetical protein